MNVSGNVFKSLYNKIDRIERVDTSFGDLNYNRMRNVHFSGNSLVGVNHFVQNPLTITYTQATASRTWTLPVIEGLPFQSWAKNAKSVLLTSPLTLADGTQVQDMPWVQTEVGTAKRQLRLNWGHVVKGRVVLQLRMDDLD